MESLRKLKNDKAAIAFIVCVFLIIFSAFMSSGFQNSFGAVEVTEVRFSDRDGAVIVGKLFRPLTATRATPAPALLGLHGFNNDKDVERPAAIELSKVGFVVLTLDQAGHGDSGGALATDGSPSSYAKGYEYLMALNFVQSNNTGLYGHSMGHSRATALAIAYPAHRVICGQSSGPSSTANASYYHNYLHIWPAWEEFGLSETTTVGEWIASGLKRIEWNYGLPAGTGASDTTYFVGGGTFANGSARRHSLIMNTHPGLTADVKATSEIVAWCLQALMFMSEADAWEIANPANQTFLYCEGFGIAAFFFTMISILPLAALMIKKTKFFNEVKQPKPERVVVKHTYTWWIFASINTVLVAVIFHYFGSYSSFVDFAPSWLIEMEWPDGSRIFPILIANGFATTFLYAGTIGIGLYALWHIIGFIRDRRGISFYDVGLSFVPGEEMQALPAKERVKRFINWRILAKTVLMACILFFWMYIIVALAQIFLNIEFRGIWTMMKALTPERAGLFWLYLWPLLILSFVGGGLILFGQLKQKERSSEIKTQAVWFLKILYATLGGLSVYVLIGYVPMWFGGSPTLNFWQNAPMMPLQLFGFIPIAAVLYYLSMNLYRQTGKIYLGCIMFAVIGVWLNVTAWVMYY